MPLLREPLLHFVVLGAVVFALHRALSPAPEVVIARAEVDAAEAAIQAREGRAPSADESDRLVADLVADEVLYQEGLDLGLDRADPVVRRRVIQKLRFLAEQSGGIGEPDDAELEAWLARDPDRYMLPEHIAFTHVFLEASDQADPGPLLEALQAGADPAPMGDPFVHGRSFDLLPLPTHGERFGEEFAAALAAAPLGAWTRIDSRFGVHLVQVEFRSPARLPGVAELRDRLVTDWSAARRDQNTEAYIDDLIEKYEVIVR